MFHPGVGAPRAAGFLEEAITLGFGCFVAAGGAGAPVLELALGHAVVIESAVRDEGTSFHYLASGRIVKADPDGVAALEATLRDADVPFSPDAAGPPTPRYRETRDRVSRRVAEGCLAVETEASAFFAVACYCNARFTQLLYPGDTLAGEHWEELDNRHKHP